MTKSSSSVTKKYDKLSLFSSNQKIQCFENQMLWFYIQFYIQYIAQNLIHEVSRTHTYTHTHNAKKNRLSYVHRLCYSQKSVFNAILTNLYMHNIFKDIFFSCIEKEVVNVFIRFYFQEKIKRRNTSSLASKISIDPIDLKSKWHTQFSNNNKKKQKNHKWPTQFLCHDNLHEMKMHNNTRKI